MSEGKLFVKDSRTSQEYEIPIKRNTIPAGAFKQIRGPVTDSTRRDQGRSPLKVYDPGLANTATIESDLLFIDSEKGQLLFRGYSIEQLWDSDFEDILHLMIWEKLPSPSQKEALRSSLAEAMQDIPSEVVTVVRTFDPSTPPVPMILAGLSAYVASRPNEIPTFAGGNIYHNNPSRVDSGIVRTLAAWAVTFGLTASHRRRSKFVPASRDAKYYENLLTMMGHVDAETGRPDPKKLRCFERFGAISIDHGMTNSTFAMLCTASSLADPISGIISALTAAYGPLHFGSTELAYRTMAALGSPDNVPALIEDVKQGKQRLFGFGHRTYTSADPRIRPIQLLLEELDAYSNPVIKIAQEIDRTASNDEYFKKRGLNANADLYAVFFYTAMGWSPEYFPLIILTQRLPGFLAHWRDAMRREIKIIRPTHVFTGSKEQAKDVSSKL